MAKGKFKYNPETLDFENSEKSLKQKIIINFVSIFVGAIIIAVSIFFVYVLFFDINIKKQKELENKILAKEYKKLLERKKQNDKYLQELIKKDKFIYQSVFKSLPDNSIFEKKNPYSKFSDTDIKTVIASNKSRIKKDIKISKEILNKYSDFVSDTTKNDFENIPCIQPVFNPNLKFPVYGFGERIDQVYKSLVFHPGIDFAVPEGTPVFASADGTVIKSGRKRGFGKRIIIDHGNGYKTVYAHLGKTYVRKREKVSKGEKIGVVGMTGKTLIPHLHYEISYNDNPINPVHFFFLDLNPETYAKIISECEKSGLSLD